MIPRSYLIAAIALVVLPAVVGVALLPFMPASVPVHFGLNGQPDRYGSPGTLVTWCVIGMLLPGVLLISLPSLGPMRGNFERFRETYGRIMVTVLGALAAIDIIILARAAGAKVPINATIFMLVGLMIAAMGNWMGKIRRNFWVGIRTPWTLASDVVWERTHRVGGPIMVAYGLIIAAAALLTPPMVSIVVVLTGAMALVIWSLVYSAMLYRRLGVDDIAPANSTPPE